MCGMALMAEYRVGGIVAVTTANIVLVHRRHVADLVEVADRESMIESPATVAA